MLTVEEQRDRDAEALRRTAADAQAREQAGLVFVLGAKLPDRSRDEEWALFLFNGSSKPVFDVCVESQRLSGGVQNHSLNLGALPPGQFVVPSDPTYHWGTLTDLSLSPERVHLLVKGKGTKMIVRVNFRDAQGLRWTLEEGTGLTRQVDPPVERS
ncbi:hypothetical protein JD292_11245 [Leucobacter sp. CSA2]|uniref:Uncharacterized protein n=1 Tax=Leucobacter edaphi TaxID=2796472 RepID=A0A934UYB6_9MICO|nr:hypothetical protein [Leucobacter edaphi]MBK0422646.1 hypothetical protein [Leucobacter edaphi]